MAEEQSAAECLLKGAVDCNHLMVYIIISSIICFYYSMCLTQLTGTRVLNQGLG